MKNRFIKIILLIAMIAVGLFIFAGCTETTTTGITDTKNNTTKQECEHDWVVTSKYNFWTGTYKTISKCSKCGKIVE